MEFVAAKLSLHQASERKELLSEHLCAVIQQNEARKAQKLSELVRLLNLENAEEEITATLTRFPPPAEPYPLFQKTPTPGADLFLSGRTRHLEGKGTGDKKPPSPSSSLPSLPSLPPPPTSRTDHHLDQEGTSHDLEERKVT